MADLTKIYLPERFRLAEGGDVSVKDAEKMAPQGDFIANINDLRSSIIKIIRWCW